MDLVALDAKVQTRVKNTQRRGISDRIVDLYTPIVDRAGKASRRVKDETECPCIRGFRVQCLVAALTIIELPRGTIKSCASISGGYSCARALSGGSSLR